MKTGIRTLAVLSLLFSLPTLAAGLDISGDWIIDSSVGGATPIKVRCSLKQTGAVLGGTCTPEMANPAPATLKGTLADGKAEWGYDVVFRDKPGHIGFRADSVSNDRISGTLSLSGTEAPFTAVRGK